MIHNQDLYSKAQANFANMEKYYAEEINESIELSNVYRDDFIRYEYDEADDTHPDSIKVMKCGSTDAIFEVGDFYTVLNFASFKHPGGGYLKGARAQEEMLCHESNLFNVIASEKFDKEYEENKSMPNNGLYQNFAIYSPGIIFHRGSQVKRCNVITCAAPNYREFSKYGSYSENLKVFEDRIDFMLNVAIDNYCDSLILGAWGCGVFQQNAKDVANLFKDALYNKYKFKNIVFAIPDEKNYGPFNKILGRL